MIDTDFIKNKKNLLAFSAGIDSTALFFLLLENNIDFDIAIVDYNLREQSKQEVQYAKELAKRYNKRCYLSIYDKDNFSEKSARDFRYKFFDTIITKYNYDILLTAHQLNDKLEWFFMQLSKGAGVFELIGLETISIRDNYNIFRPLLELSKDELEDYLNRNNYKYFIDETNTDIRYKRNYFRKEFSNKFIKEYKDGVKNSMQYLQNDIDSLTSLYNSFIYKDIYYAKFLKIDHNIMIRYIDQVLKKFGIMISKDTRDEILKQKEIIVSKKIAISIIDNIIWIAPKLDNNMNKKFKEKCRVLKIPKNILLPNNVLDELSPLPNIHLSC